MTPQEILDLPEGTLCRIVSLREEDLGTEHWKIGDIIIRKHSFSDDLVSSAFHAEDSEFVWDFFYSEEVELLYPLVRNYSSDVVPQDIITQEPKNNTEQEYTGSSSSYYTVFVENPTTEGVEPYTVECNDIIEALGMSFAEGNAFKAIWRSCAARLGKVKKGYVDGQYDAEKVVFFGERMLAKALFDKANA